MRISDLPSDLVEEILFRVPTTSLGRSRFTCKRWNALVNDPRFIKKHFDKVARQTHVVTLVNSRVYLMSVNLHGVHNNVIEFTRKLNLIDSHRNSGVKIHKVFHCDGLLLGITNAKKLVVWNPCTGQTMWLKHRDPDDSFDMYALGYANNKVPHSYKILRRSSCYTEIYEFSSDSWRAVDGVDLSIRSRGVSLKGNTYWIASSPYTYDFLLLRFDFATEKYQRLSLPFQDSCIDQDTTVLSVDREEQLSAFHWNFYKHEVEIWVSITIETTTVSWRNFLKLDLYNGSKFWLSDDASFLIDEDKKVAALCDVHITKNLVYIIGEGKDRFREISLGESSDLYISPVMFNYVPSLVRIQQGKVTSGHKRKRS